MTAHDPIPRPPDRARRSAVARYAAPLARKAARMVGFALIRDTADGWADLAQWLHLRLTARDRASLAFAALSSLDEDAADLVAMAALVRIADLDEGAGHG